MGFIVRNRERYPQFSRMLDELGIETRPTTMSFSVVARRPRVGQRVAVGAVRASAGGSSIRGTGGSSSRSIAVPAPRAQRDSRQPAVARARRSTSTSPRGACSREVRERFVVPLAAALWSLAPEQLRRVPRGDVLRVPRSARHAVAGAAARVAHDRRRQPALRRCAARRAAPRGSRCASPRRSTRDRARCRGVTMSPRDGREHASIASSSRRHADTALALLAEPTADERRVLGAFRYSANRTVLHTDRSVLAAPRAPRTRLELRRRSRYRARRGHVLDDAAAGPARRAVSRHAQSAARAARHAARGDVRASAARSRRARRAGRAAAAARHAAHVLRRRALRLRLSRGRHARGRARAPRASRRDAVRARAASHERSLARSIAAS